MEPTNDILIDSADEMYRLLLPHAAKMRVENVGATAFLFTGMKELHDPNVCNCKKGAKRVAALKALYASLPVVLNAEQKKYLSDLFGGTLVLVNEGVTLGRLE